MLIEWYNKPCGEGNHYDYQFGNIIKCMDCGCIRKAAAKQETTASQTV